MAQRLPPILSSDVNPASHALLDASTPLSGKCGASRVVPPMTLNPPLAARLNVAAVVPVVPTSTSRETTDVNTVAAAVNQVKATLMPSLAK